MSNLGSDAGKLPFSLASGSKGNASTNQNVQKTRSWESSHSSDLEQRVTRFIFGCDFRKNSLLGEFRNTNEIMRIWNSCYCLEWDPKFFLHLQECSSKNWDRFAELKRHCQATRFIASSEINFNHSLIEKSAEDWQSLSKTWRRG
jgi:hypothetical protein